MINNFELLSYAIKSNHDYIFGDDLELVEKNISDESLNSFVLDLLNLDFLNKKYIGCVEKLFESRELISQKWCNSYNRNEIAHYDFLLSVIDFMRGNKRKLIDIVFYISNIYASNRVGEITKLTVEIKNKFHEFSYEFRKKLINSI